jgi:hypothetical protein
MRLALERAVGVQQAESVAGRGRWTPSRGTVKGRVLILEDEELVREAMGPLLAEAGHEVWCAENGHDALTLLDDPIAIDVNSFIEQSAFLPLRPGRSNG